MAGTLLDLSKRMEALAADLSKQSSECAVKVALAVVGEFAYRTPVDTSQALSNWIVTLDAPTTITIGPHYPGEQGSTYRASAAETLAMAKLVLAAKKPGQSIFITNLQPYIRKLNDGTHSQQAGGFLERGMMVGRKVRNNFKFG